MTVDTQTSPDASPLTEDAVRPFARLAPRGCRLRRRQGCEPRRADLRGTAGSGRLRRRRSGIRGVPRADRAARATGGAARRRRRGGHRGTSGRQCRRTRAVRSDPDARALARKISFAYEQLARRGSPDAGRRALLRHRRGHRRHFLRRDERDIPEHPRRRRGDRRCAPLLALAVRRAHRSTTAASTASHRPTWTSPSSCSARSTQRAPA